MIKRLASILALSATSLSASCGTPDEGFRKTFALWQCNSREEPATINRAVERVAAGLGFDVETGSITHGGSGTSISLNKNDLEVTVLVMDAGNVVNVVAAHKEKPNKMDRESTLNIVSALRTPSARPSPMLANWWGSEGRGLLLSYSAIAVRNSMAALSNR